MSPDHPRVSVIGLGYVGLPLALALARHFPVMGFDASEDRICQLRKGQDSTGEVDSDALLGSALGLTTDPDEMAASDLFIVAVPTPVDSANRPNLEALLSACRLVGRSIRPGGVVVFESTVYPGVTEDICGGNIAEISGLECGKDFFLGYSPERMNPGDKVHSVDRITKVVAGQTAEVVDLLTQVYGAVTNGDLFVARDIRTAEAAKVIENAQRDINIAFVNEITQMFRRAGLSVYDVLEAASTKWNFLDFRPGLVGGHCIGVDPFYLAHWAQSLGHHPEIILAGRRLNDSMGAYVADEIARALKADENENGRRRILVLGLTFKEDVPDLRNSRVVDLVLRLRQLGFKVDVHDPLADRDEAQTVYGIELVSDLKTAGSFDCLVGAVPHRQYRELDTTTFDRLVRAGGLVADVKGLWRNTPLPAGLQRWEL